MKIQQSCANYFKGFHEIWHCKTNSASKNVLAIAKIFTYCTGGIPILVGIIYGIACLAGRVSKKASPSDQDKRTDSASSVLGTKQDVTTKGLISASFCGRDATYEGSPNGNCDQVHVDQENGFAFVLDGTGHGDEQMGAAMATIAQQMAKSYASNQANSSDEARSLFVGNLKSFATLIRSNNTIQTHKADIGYTPGTNCPAAIFTQVCKGGDKRYVLHAQFDDCTLLIRKQSGEFITFPYKNRGQGLGDIQNDFASTVLVTEVEEGDQIFGFSDGIGEFLSLEQCKSVLNQWDGTNGPSLLEAFKKAIQSDTEDGTALVAGRRKKLFDATNPGRVDDISLFALQVK